MHPKHEEKDADGFDDGVAEFPSLRREALPTEDALDLIAHSATAAFAIDRHDRVVYWNEGAERMLGWKASEVVGRFCFDVIEGRDPFGNMYCNRSCPIFTGASVNATIEPFWIEVANKQGGRNRVVVRAIPLPGPGDSFSCLMHLMEHGDSTELDKLLKSLRSFASGEKHVPLPEPALSVSPLTAREREILQLLSNGYAALNIAARLNLSHATVRNHIQNMLRKLDVHSQVEAIAVSFRRGWI